MTRHKQPGLIAMYRYICLITMMEYVGQSNDFDTRHSGHLYGKSAKIDKAIDQFGIENFVIDIIEYVPDEVSDRRESFWIAELGTLWPNGYNVRPGGATARGWHQSEEQKEKSRVIMKEKYGNGKHPLIGIPRPEDVRKKISESQIGKVISEEARRKNSEAHKGQIPWMTGKHHTEQSLEKMRAKATRGEDHKDAKLTTEQVIAIIADPRSSRKIAKDYKVNHKHILAIKNGTKWKHIPR